MNTTMDQMLVKLAVAKPYVDIELNGITIKPINTVEGCNGCIFNDGGKANTCGLKYACMAHRRPDRQSLIFVNSEN